MRAIAAARPGVIALLVVALAGCGTRLDHDRLLAAATGPAPTADLAETRAGASAAGTVGQDGTGSAGAQASATPGGAGASTGAVSAPTPGAGADAGDSGVPAAATEQACTGDEAPIVIGTVGQQSGVVGSAIAGGPQAVRAWATAVNASGGLRCHPIDYIVKDDGGDPSRHQALMRELVESDGAIAVVHSNAGLTGQSSVGYLTDRGIPVIGSEGGSEWFYSSPMYFPQASTGDQTLITAFPVAAERAAELGDQRLATVSCIEAPACVRLKDMAPAQAARFGLELVYRGEVTIVQPDYSSVCQAARNAGAAIMIMSVDSNSASRVARSCASVNYHPQYVMISSTAGRADDPLLDGMAITQQTLPWMVTGTPAIDEYHDVFRRYAPGLQPGAATVVGWVSAKLFERAARLAPDPTTSAGILEGLWSLSEDDLGGLTYPLTFSRQQNAPVVACYWNVRVSGGEYVSPDGGVRACV